MSEPGGNTMKHLDEMTCLLYLERQLDRARGLEVSAHTQECETCRTLLRALERESRLLTRAMLEDVEPLPSRLSQFQEKARGSMQWIWGLVLGLAATGAYALYTTYILPWQTDLEHAGLGGSNLLNLLIFQSPLWKGWQSMITLLEILALATLGVLGLMFLRRRIRRGSALALVFAGLCAAAFVAPAPASATELRHQERVTIEKNEVIHGDLFVASGRIQVDGTIEGDLVAAGGQIEVRGHVLGDVISSSGQMTMTGQVDGNIRGYAGNITIKGKVGHNVMVFGGDVNIDRDAVISGSITTGSGHLSVDGQVGRDVLAMGGQVTLSGNINGSVNVRAGELSIDSSAQVGGPIDFHGDRPAQVSPEAKLASPVHFVKMRHGPDYESAHYYIWRLIWTAAFILFGLVLLLLLPKFGRDAIESGEQVAIPILLGILVLFGVPIAAIIACVTVVGIPLGVLTLGIWMLMLCTAELVVGAVVGNWILGRGSSNWEVIGRMALGFVIVRIVYTPLAQLHVVGGLVALGIWIWGMGAMSLAIYHRFQPVLAKGGPATPSGTPIPPNTTVGGPLPA